MSRRSDFDEYETEVIVTDVGVGTGSRPGLDQALTQRARDGWAVVKIFDPVRSGGRLGVHVESYTVIFGRKTPAKRRAGASRQLLVEYTPSPPNPAQAEPDAEGYTWSPTLPPIIPWDG